MPTNVIPSWVKSLIMTVILVVVWWWWPGHQDRSTHKDEPILLSSSDAENGLSDKIGANIRQFGTNPLEPAPLPEGGIVILRGSGQRYYQDEP